MGFIALFSKRTLYQLINKRASFWWISTKCSSSIFCIFVIVMASLCIMHFFYQTLLSFKCFEIQLKSSCLGFDGFKIKRFLCKLLNLWLNIFLFLKLRQIRLVLLSNISKVSFILSKVTILVSFMCCWAAESSFKLARMILNLNLIVSIMAFISKLALIV